MTFLKKTIAALSLLTLVACNENPVSGDDSSWTAVAARVGPAVYCIGIIEDGELIQLATGFAISSNVIATNGHVARGLEEVKAFYSETVRLVAVVNGGDVSTGEGVHDLVAYAVHPGYVDTAEIESFDLALVTTATTLPAVLRFETDAMARRLAPGDAIATIGFPGELDIIHGTYPVATFKNGTVSALRALDGTAPTLANRFFVQHNLNLSPGTSGSPIFNRAGRVVAVNNSGIITQVCTDDFGCVEIPGSLGFGIRADGFAPVLEEERLFFADIEYVGGIEWGSVENPHPVVARLMRARGH